MKTGSRLAGPSALACFLAAAILFVPDAARAQETKPQQLIQEAFIGDLAFTQERGEVQIGSVARVNGAASNRSAGVSLGVEYGITDELQVSVETGGFNYERATGWSSPDEFGFGLRYGRYGLLPHLHAALSLGEESQGSGGARTTSTTSGLQLGVDIPRLAMTHVFTSVSESFWNSEGSDNAVDWIAGAVVPFGRLRATVERALSVADAADRGTVPGLVWKVTDVFEIGAATTLRTRPAARLSGAMLSLILEF
jgi:hypothetical protein